MSKIKLKSNISFDIQYFCFGENLLVPMCMLCLIRV